MIPPNRMLTTALRTACWIRDNAALAFVAMCSVGGTLLTVAALAVRGLAWGS